eukprot:GHVU01100684.1.p1 GENE.GHVU01100684.1~~GHVU01100684.1.p1  ORF type:complete len:132 (-),score=9.63 GHVU01100684.1:280-675(-)
MDKQASNQGNQSNQRCFHAMWSTRTISGLLLRAVDSDNFISVLIDGRSGPRVESTELVRGKAVSTVSTATETRIEPEVWYKLQASDTGSLIFISLDDEVRRNHVRAYKRHYDNCDDDDADGPGPSGKRRFE